MYACGVCSVFACIAGCGLKVCVLFVGYCVMLHGMVLFVRFVVRVVCLCVFFYLVCDAVW